MKGVNRTCGIGVSQLFLEPLMAVVLLSAFAVPGALASPAPSPDPCFDEERETPLPEPIEICGRVVLSASQASAVTLRVPQDVQISREIGPDGGIGVVGGGDFAGVVLTQDVPARDGPFLFAGLVPAVGRDVFFSFQLGSPPSGSSLYTIPAGIYVAYLLADGVPVEVTLNFEGLDGSVQVEPARAVPFSAIPLPTQIAPHPSSPVYTAGAPGAFGHPGVAFAGVWLSGSTHVAGQYGRCLYEGEPPAYLPHCPDAFYQGRGDQVVLQDTYSWKGTYGVSRPVPPGVWSQEAWFASASVPAQVFSMALWLDMA